jgi:Bacterial Ig-like domain (group 1)
MNVEIPRAMPRSSIGLGLALLAAASGCKSSSTTTPTTEPPNVVAVVSGDGQSVVVHEPATEPLVVRVTDGSGAPVAGVTVTFVPGIGGIFSTPPATDADGRTSATFTASSRAGVDTLRASTPTSTSKGVFVFTILPGPAAALRKLAGDGQVAPPGTILTYPFVVDVKDADANNLLDVAVTWSTTAGTLSVTATPTDSTGQAQTVLTLPATAGTYKITAHVDGLADVTFTAFAR